MKKRHRFLHSSLSFIICIALFLTALPTTSYANQAAEGTIDPPSKSEDENSSDKSSNGDDIDTSRCNCTSRCPEGSSLLTCPVCRDHPEYCQGDAQPDEPSATSPPDIDQSILDGIGNLQEQQNQLKQEQDRLNQLISGAKNEKQKQQIISQNLDYQISLTKQEISLLNEKIDIMKRNITSKEALIDAKELAIDNSMTLFRDRVRALYLSGGGSSAGNYLTMLFSSQSISEFLTRSEILRRISEHDQKLIDGMRAELLDIKEQKEEVLAEKLLMEDDIKALDAKNESLGQSLSTASATLQDLAALEQQYLANRTEVEGQMQAVQNEIADIYAKYNSQFTDYVGGEMAWPVPGFSNITSYYGARWGSVHTGIDISSRGIHGSNIVASNTGTVMFVRTSGFASGPAGGYGMYLIIDHGGGRSTLYGHCSAVYVNEGDVVAQGQPIAAVGSTGWSTGPHLHFEVRIDGSPVDPLPYVQG